MPPHIVGEDATSEQPVIPCLSCQHRINLYFAKSRLVVTVRVLDKGPNGSKVLARYVLESSSIKAEKEH